MFVLLVAAIIVSEPTVYRIPVQPQTWQAEDTPETFMKGFSSVATNGTDIFIADIQDPKVVQFKPDGSFVRMIGGRGQGPSELGSFGPKAIAAKGSALWILTSRGRTAKYFEDGEYITSFKPWHYIQYGSMSPSYRFDFTNNQILLQTFPVKKKLARVYDYAGNAITDVGNELPRQMEYLEVNPTLNHTMWQFDGQHWYALFFHRPLLRKFDQEFNQVAEFTIVGPEIDQFEQTFFENEKDPKWTYPKPHFTDFLVFRDFIFGLSNGALYQINKDSGKVISRTYFYAEGQYAELNNHGRFNTHMLTLLDSGQLFLFNQFIIMEADVWVPENVPYFEHVNASP